MLRQSNKDLGQTVMMITHNPEAAEYGDRIVHMRDGQIVTPDEDPQWSPHPSGRIVMQCLRARLYEELLAGAEDFAERRRFESGQRLGRRDRFEANVP